MRAAQALLIAVSIVALAGVAPAQTAPESDPHYSKKQIKEMMHDAHTPEQYRVLAKWFRSQEQTFEDKAAAERKDWEQRVGGYKVDPARNRYEYYIGKAQQMADRAAHYERWATYEQGSR